MPSGAAVYGQDGNDSLGLTVSFNSSTIRWWRQRHHLCFTRGISSQFMAEIWDHDSLYFSDTSFNNSTVYGGNTSDATSADGLTPFGSAERSALVLLKAMVVQTPFMSVEQL